MAMAKLVQLRRGNRWDESESRVNPKLTPQQQSAEPRNSASAEALSVPRRPKEASRENILLLIGLHTILPLPILYGVWHTKGGAGGRRVLRHGRTTVLQ